MDARTFSLGLMNLNYRYNDYNDGKDYDDNNIAVAKNRNIFLPRNCCRYDTAKMNYEKISSSSVRCN